MSGMSALGFQLYLSPEARSYIITSFIYPAHPAFSFESFYSRLSDKGFVIYPGKLSKTDCFRIGNIGQLYPDDMHHLVAAVKDSLDEMKINLLKK
jgi:2-aminoethylphosphonate-pyruvate transaminase